MGEPGSAGTHSCFMVPFQEELLDLFVFTGSQFVCLRACTRACACVRASARLCGCGSSGADLLSLSSASLGSTGAYLQHLQRDAADMTGGGDLPQLVLTLTAAFRSHLKTDTPKLALGSLICSLNRWFIKRSNDRRKHQTCCVCCVFRSFLRCHTLERSTVGFLQLKSID